MDETYQTDKIMVNIPQVKLLDEFNTHIQAKILLECFTSAMQQKEILSVCLCNFQ